MTAVMIVKGIFDDRLADGEIAMVMPFFQVLIGPSEKDPRFFFFRYGIFTLPERSSALTGCGHVGTQTRSDFFSLQFAGSHLKGELLQFSIGHIQPVAVDIQKQEGGHRAYPFVPVRKAVVHHQVIEVNRRQFHPVALAVLIGPAWRFQCRKKSGLVTNAERAAVELNLVLVDELDFFQRKENWFLHRLSLA